MLKQRRQYAKYVEEKHCGLTAERVAALNEVGFDWGSIEPLPKKTKRKGKEDGEDGKKKSKKGWDDLMQKKHNSWMVMLDKLKDYRKEYGYVCMREACRRFVIARRCKDLAHQTICSSPLWMPHFLLYSNCIVPRGWPDDTRLANWVATQR